MKFADNCIAVGAATKEGHESCVVLVTQGVTIQISEHSARKLADDILRNANWLWPVAEENT
jgi:hypothetical protein